MNRETACSLILYDIHIFQLAPQIKQPNSLNLLPHLRRQRPAVPRFRTSETVSTSPNHTDRSSPRVAPQATLGANPSAAARSRLHRLSCRHCRWPLPRWRRASSPKEVGVFLELALMVEAGACGASLARKRMPGRRPWTLGYGRGGGGVPGGAGAPRHRCGCTEGQEVVR
jgi:hypothetical protein